MREMRLYFDSIGYRLCFSFVSIFSGRKTCPGCFFDFVCTAHVEQDILAVMTDRLHKSGFKMHATLLKHMFQLVEGGQITLELYDVAQHPNITVI